MFCPQCGNPISQQQPAATSVAESQAGPQRPTVEDAARAPVEPARAVERPLSQKPKNGRRTLRIVSWSVTGGLLAGAVTTGLLAMQSSNELESMCKHELVTRDELRQQEAQTSRLAIASDVLTGLTVVAAAASLWITLKRESRPGSSARHARTRGARVDLGLAPRALLLQTRF